MVNLLKLVQRNHLKLKSSFSPAVVLVFRVEMYISLSACSFGWWLPLDGGVELMLMFGYSTIHVSCTGRNVSTLADMARMNY